MLRLPRFGTSLNGFGPFLSRLSMFLSARCGSPVGGSTLITSAPRSARIAPAAGTNVQAATSSTRTPSSGFDTAFPLSVLFVLCAGGWSGVVPVRTTGILTHVSATVTNRVSDPRTVDLDQRRRPHGRRTLPRGSQSHLDVRPSDRRREPGLHRPDVAAGGRVRRRDRPSHVHDGRARSSTPTTALRPKARSAVVRVGQGAERRRGRPHRATARRAALRVPPSARRRRGAHGHRARRARRGRRSPSAAARSASRSCSSTTPTSTRVSSSSPPGSSPSFRRRFRRRAEPDRTEERP